MLVKLIVELCDRRMRVGDKKGRVEKKEKRKKGETLGKKRYGERCAARKDIGSHTWRY